MQPVLRFRSEVNDTVLERHRETPSTVGDDGLSPALAQACIGDAATTVRAANFLALEKHRAL